MTEDQATQLSADDGWVLGHASWPFHRAFCCRFGRPMEFREYAHLAGQVRAFRRAIGQKTRDGADPVICFVTASDGQSVAVQTPAMPCAGSSAATASSSRAKPGTSAGLSGLSTAWC